MITLLNGDAWGYEEIKTQMYEDEFYYGHLGKYAFSSSAMNTLLDSPKRYKRSLTKATEPTEALRLGKLFHTMVLEPHKVDKMHFVDVLSSNAKAYKDAVLEHGEVFTRKERVYSERLTDAMLMNKEVNKFLNKAEFEVPEIAMLDGYAVRGKADILKGDHIIDLKTSRNVKGFRQSAQKLGYDLQAYIYKTLFKAKEFTFLVIDKNTTDIAIFETSEEFIDSGRLKFEQALRLYEYFFVEENNLEDYVFRGVL